MVRSGQIDLPGSLSAVDEDGLVGLQVGLDGLNSRQLDRDSLGIQSTEVPVMSQALANLQDFDMAVRQLPNLAFGELFWRRHLLLWFHKISNRPKQPGFPRVRDSTMGLSDGQSTPHLYSINPKRKMPITVQICVTQRL